MFPTAAAQAVCPADIAALTAAIDDAEAAYTALREDRFRWSRHEARRLLGCLDAPVTGELAARLHLVEILDARLAGDDARLEDAIEGMVAAAPEYQPDSRVAPSGSSLARAIDVARGESWSNETRRLPDGDAVDWVVDGDTSASQFPLDRASVVQRLGAEDRGWYLSAGEVPEALLPEPFAQLSRPLTVAAVTAGALAGVAWTAATLTAPDPGDLKGGESGPNAALARAGVGLSVGALGLGAAAVVTTRWDF